MKSMRINLLRIGFLALAMLGFSSLASAGEGLFSPADLPKAKQAYSPDSQCVEPVEVMRRWHMEFIRHQRDKTMHQGIRTSKHSLVGCIDCHVSPGADIHSKEHFCTACHSYAAVRVDCFQCHAATPQPETAQTPVTPPVAPQEIVAPGVVSEPIPGGSQP